MAAPHGARRMMRSRSSAVTMEPAGLDGEFEDDGLGARGDSGLNGVSGNAEVFGLGSPRERQTLPPAY